MSAVERQRQALELRKAGQTFEDIAVQLGYGGPSGAYRAVMSGLKRTLQEPADELRQLEVARLDGLFAVAWSKAIAGNLAALDRCLAIQERRARLLGLDAPSRIDVEPMIRQRAIEAGLDPDLAVQAAEQILRGRSA